MLPNHGDTTQSLGQLPVTALVLTSSFSFQFPELLCSQLGIGYRMLIKSFPWESVSSSECYEMIPTGSFPRDGEEATWWEQSPVFPISLPL